VFCCGLTTHPPCEVECEVRSDFFYGCYFLSFFIFLFVRDILGTTLLVDVAPRGSPSFFRTPHYGHLRPWVLTADSNSTPPDLGPGIGIELLLLPRDPLTPLPGPPPPGLPSPLVGRHSLFLTVTFGDPRFPPKLPGRSTLVSPPPLTMFHVRHTTSLPSPVAGGFLSRLTSDLFTTWSPLCRKDKTPPCDVF